MKIKVSNLAEILKSSYTGNAEKEILNIKSIEESDENSICYIENEEILKKNTNLKFACLIAPLKLKNKLNLNGSIIWVDNPKYSFSIVLKLVQNEIEKKYSKEISSKAQIDSLAKISANVYIGPFVVIEKGVIIEDDVIIEANSYIGENSKISKGTKIYPNVTIRENVFIGENCIIHSGSVLGSDGYGYVNIKGKNEKIPQIGNVKIGNFVEIGSNVSIDKATIGSTEIGNGTKIDNLVHIAHNVKIGENCLLIAQAGIAGSTIIGKNVIIAGQAGISDHVEIEDNCIIMAKSGVMGKVKKGSILFGYLARPRMEYLKIEAILSKLPEIYSFYKKAKNILKIENEKNNLK